MARIDKSLAVGIARKLKARINSRSGKAHDLALVYHKDKLVASFGIRRGSKRSLGHDHVPGQIHVTPREARLLGQCPMSREEWIGKLREKGFI